MNKDKILDDIAQLAGGAVSAASGISQNIHAEIKSRAEEIIDRLDLVPRADLDRLETMVQELNKRVQTLEEKQTTPKKKKA